MSEQLHKEGRQAIESATRRGDDLVHACLLAMALDALKKAESERDTLLRRVEAAERVCEAAGEMHLYTNLDGPSELVRAFEAALTAWSESRKS